VHLATFPESEESGHAEILDVWDRLFAIRDEVLAALEQARIAKQIGSSLEARVEISAGGATYRLLQQHQTDLRYLFIVSQVDLHESTAPGSDLVVKIHRADGTKCERCWNYSTRVGESARYPTICERCVTALEEIESYGS
jgi:isoleucyl-tRNA synthetase